MSAYPLRTPPKSNLDAYVRQYCTQHNLSMKELANHAGLAKATLYDLLTPEKDARMSQIVNLARAMNVHPQILLQLKWADFDVSNICPAMTKPIFVDNLAHKPTSNQLDASAFISEHPADGILLAPNTHFTKSWTIQNVGRTVWQNRFLACQNPFAQSAYPEIPSIHDYCLRSTTDKVAIATTHPGECVTISVDFITPSISGSYISYWKMIDEQGNYCFKDGIGLSTLIVVQTLGISHAP